MRRSEGAQDVGRVAVRVVQRALVQPEVLEALARTRAVEPEAGEQCPHGVYAVLDIERPVPSSYSSFAHRIVVVTGFSPWPPTLTSTFSP
jgi:hypothetical protein